MTNDDRTGPSGGDQRRDTMQFPAEHPLADYDTELETHEDHLRAYAEVLDKADEENAQAVMLVLTGEEGTETLPSVSQDLDPRWASLWMLGAHIYHVASAASESSGSQTSMEHIAQDAIETIRKQLNEVETNE